MQSPIIIRPQPGPQESFLSSSADITIYGGAAGGGKTWGMLIEPLRHIHVPDFGAIYFRKNAKQVSNIGGLWDESLKIYPMVGGLPAQSVLSWTWPNRVRIKFDHLEYESTVLAYQGAQIPLICFDELTHFSAYQFFYMLSRNRSTCGVRPYLRASTNPDPDSWVAEFIAWWIDQDTGLPIYERGGRLRWFIRISDSIIWADTKEELVAKYGPDTEPKSVTFIPAKLTDNKILMKKDPGYMANLKAMSRVERERLLGGNWKIRPSAGLYFPRNNACIIESIPTDVTAWVRRWDLAATEPNESNPDPDWTAGDLMGRRSNGRYVVAHVEHHQLRAIKVRELIKNCASNDQQFLASIYGRPIRVLIGIPQDPGQAGKEQIQSYISELAGFIVDKISETGDKITRAEPFAAQWQAGNVDIVRGPWNEAFISELEAFPTKKVHDDQVDSAAGAFIMLTVSSLSTWAKLGKTR